MATDFNFDNQGNFVNEDGDYTHVEGAAEVAQSANFRLLMIKGESAYDTTLGVDWFGIMFPTDTSTEQKIAEVRGVILGTPGINSLLSFNFAVDQSIRTARVTYEADTVFGTTGEITQEVTV